MLLYPSDAKTLWWKDDKHFDKFQIDIKKAMGKEINTENTVIIGDQLYTDIVFGNTHGMATIKVKPIDLLDEPFSEMMIRTFEDGVIKRTLGSKRRKHPEIDMDL